MGEKFRERERRWRVGWSAEMEKAKDFFSVLSGMRKSAVHRRVKTKKGKNRVSERSPTGYKRGKKKKETEIREKQK